MKRAPGIVGILIFIGFLLLIDYYVFTGVRTITLGLEARTRKIVHWIYWIISLSFFAWLGLIIMFHQFQRNISAINVHLHRFLGPGFHSEIIVQHFPAG